MQLQTGDVVGPFFGFMGAAAALVFACKSLLLYSLLRQVKWHVVVLSSATLGSPFLIRCVILVYTQLAPRKVRVR